GVRGRGGREGQSRLIERQGVGVFSAVPRHRRGEGGFFSLPWGPFFGGRLFQEGPSGRSPLMPEILLLTARGGLTPAPAPSTEPTPGTAGATRGARSPSSTPRRTPSISRTTPPSSPASRRPGASRATSSG